MSLDIVVQAQREALELALSDAPLEAILTVIARTIEKHSAGQVFCSVLLVAANGKHLRLGAAPSLPRAYCEAVDGIKIAPDSAPCGRAAHTAESVEVTDTKTDPLWENFRELALAHGLKASWAIPIKSAQGKVLGVFALYFRDIKAQVPAYKDIVELVTHTAALIIERKKAEAELNESEERLRLALSSTSSGVWDWNISTGAVNWSSGLEGIHGMKQGSFGGTFADFESDIHPDDKDLVKESIRKAVENCAVHNIEYRIVLPNGQIRWVEAKGAVLCNEDSKPFRMVGVCMDITDRKQAEEARATLNAVVESSSDAVISQSLDGTIATWNEGAAKIFGYEASEIIGQPFEKISRDFLRGHDQDSIASSIEENKPQHFEAVYYHKKGHEIHVSVSVSLVRNQNGQVVGIAKIARDITEKIKRRDRDQLLIEASDLFASSLDYTETLTNLGSITVPRLADWYAVYIVDEQGLLQRLTVEAKDKSQLEWADQIHRRFPPKPTDTTGPYQVLRTGEAEFYPDIDEALIAESAQSEEQHQVLLALSPKSAIMIPLSAQGRIFGVLSLISTNSNYRYTNADLNLAKELGRKAGLAISNAKLFQQAQMSLQKYKTELHERERAETAVRNSEQIYRAIGESIKHGIWICDPQGLNIYFSESFLRLVGMTQEECSGFGWAKAVHPDEAENILKAWNECVRSTGNWDIMIRFKGVDGNWHPVLTRGVPVKNEKGELIYWAGINLDISSQKQAEDELRRAKDAADAANEAKSAFLANMSHEIRTPLGAILGFSELLASPAQAPEVIQEYVEIIKRNGQLLSTLIDDILDLSKVEAGKLTIVTKSIDLETLLEEVKDGLNLYASEKGVQLTLASKGPIPLRVRTDEFRLKQILNNIIGNAIKFTEQGSVDVSLQIQNIKNGKPVLYFEVSDTGRGISEEQAKKLFQPFSQADASTSRNYGGTGLGLVLSRKLARLLGGDIDLIRSKLNQGSTFAITIDPDLQIANEVQVKPKVQKKRIESKARNCLLQGLRVLVVDDAPDNRLLISRLLKTEGANVALAENGREAVDKALTGDYDVVLMDVQMPIMDGHTATRELRKLGCNLPIMALTAHAMREEREQCLSIGFNEYYSKPINRADLVAGLQKYKVDLEKINKTIH